MKLTTLSIDAVRIKQISNLQNASALKLSYFDKSPAWLVSALNDNRINLYNGSIYVDGNGRQAGPGDYLIKTAEGIEIKTHTEIMEQYHA